MADIPSNIPGAPEGAVPMKKSTGKVQPKKETVRINLPPKPSAAPTIKLPTLPPAGPTGVPSMAPASAAAAPAAPKPAISAPGIPKQATSPAATAPRPMTAAAPTVRPMSGVDKGLVIGALVAALVAIGTTAYFAFMF